MKIVVYPHELGMGGSQLNAIELAAAVRDLGHEVIVFGRPGALNARVDELGVEFVAAPPPGKRPSPTTARALADLVTERGIDVIHGYEWPPTLDAVLATRMGAKAAVVSTVMSMSVPPFIPRSVPLVVGTEEIGEGERVAGRTRTAVIEPPVDLVFNDIDSDAGAEEFARRYGLGDDKITIVAVARFARELKLEGTLTAIDVVGELSATHPVRLLLVGDGPAREDVEARAAAVNERYGAGTVVLTGQIDDPRPAYAFADIALGMGGSALRALAYGAPLVVQGERGFWKALTPESVDDFLWTGWYGIGAGAEHGAETLRRELQPLVEDAELRRTRGDYGLQLVRERFSLTRAAEIQLGIYRKATERPARAALLNELAATARYGDYYVRKRVRRALGNEAADDFNSRPVTLRNSARLPVGELPAKRRPILWFSGVKWDDHIVTDHYLARELAAHRPVIWVDSPGRGNWRGWWSQMEPSVTEVAPGIRRLRVPGLPGFSRFPVRVITRLLMQVTMRRYLKINPYATVMLDPVTRFPRGIKGRRVLMMTDDWVAGAELMGYSRPWLAGVVSENLRAADAVIAVSPVILDAMDELVGGIPGATKVIPNGSPSVPRHGDVAREDVAGVVGQFNERLDLGLLEAVADAGIRLRLIGPRADSEPEFSSRLDALIARPEVEWLGPVPGTELPSYLAAFGVGLTPYADSDFNRSSFPLKTLEYLAAGLPVVTTDLPASRWLGDEQMTIAESTDQFVAATREKLHVMREGLETEQDVQARIAFAAEHGWDRRALKILELVESI